MTHFFSLLQNSRICGRCLGTGLEGKEINCVWGLSNALRASPNVGRLMADVVRGSFDKSVIGAWDIDHRDICPPVLQMPPSPSPLNFPLLEQILEEYETNAHIFKHPLANTEIVCLNGLICSATYVPCLQNKCGEIRLQANLIMPKTFLLIEVRT